MEYEWTSGKKGQSLASATTQAAHTSEVERSTQHHSRKAVVANGEKAKTIAANSPAPKDTLPGTSMFVVSSDSSSQSQSKKRKAGQPDPIVGGPAQSLQTPATSTRKNTQSVPASSTARETNMVSFENCQAYLSHGCLVADDKTRFRVNGESYSYAPILPLVQPM